MPLLGLLFGSLVGLSLGLTGGGGAIFAVPLLVYGMGVPIKEAVAISLASVGATALVGFLARWKQGQVELRTGLLFALAGMLGAPVGSQLANLLPEPLLLLLFGGLMLIVAYRLWQQASRATAPAVTCPLPDSGSADCEPSGPTCQRDAAGQLRLTSRCAMLLLAVGLGTGVLSGLFGVGGGFVIVPALVLFSSMPIHRAVGTSLMVIALVSVSGLASQWYSGREISPGITALFVLGGMGGLFLGQRIGRRLPGPVLQKTFVVAILAVATFVIGRNLSA